MFYLRGHKQVEQQQAGIQQVRADAQQRVESGDRIGQQLKGPGGNVRRCVTRGQVKRRNALTVETGRAARRDEPPLAAGKHRLRAVDAVYPNTRFEERDEEPPGARHTL